MEIPTHTPLASNEPTFASPAATGNQNRRLTVILAILLVLLLGLIYLYWVLTKPPVPVKKVPTKGIVNLFSIYGWGKERFRSPDGIATDASGNIYVTDTSNHRVAVFNSSGRYRFSFGDKIVKRRSTRLKPGHLLVPLGIAVAPNGDIYVASAMKYTIEVFNKKGKFKREIKVDRPIRLAIKHNRLYITTVGKVLVATLKGKVLKRFGSKGRDLRQFESPNGIAVDGKGNIFIADSENDRVQILSKKGKLIGLKGNPTVNMTDSDRLFGLAMGLTMDDQGRIYIADALHHAIRVFDNDGNDLGEYGTQGSADGTFNYPTDIVYLGGNKFAVTDKWNDRVQVIRVNLKRSALSGKSSQKTPVYVWLILLLLLILTALLLLRRYLGGSSGKRRQAA